MIDVQAQPFQPSDHSASQTRKWTVMVIDDAPSIRNVAKKWLQDAGHRVILAEDGFEALSLITQTRPDLIFLDVQMERVDGYETCQMIKQNERFASIPVLMLSAEGSIFNKARGRLLGAAEYLQKPFSLTGLLEMVDKYARDTSGEAA